MTNPPCDRLVVAFELDVRPQPKRRPRFTKAGRTYPDARDVEYEDTLLAAAHKAMDYADPHTGDVHVWAVFEQKDGRRSDLDNLVKSLLDGISDPKWGAIANDRQVIETWAAMKVRAPRDRVSVAVIRTNPKDQP